MILPVYAYGQPVLRQVGVDIDQNYPQLDKLIADMWETMYFSDGVGLAAPQIGLAIRLFVVDTVQLKDKKGQEGIKKVFINAEIIEESGRVCTFEEGCLSIPNIHADVNRQERVLINYLDENFVEHEEVFEGFNARVIQHEYDHIEGILFVDKVAPLKKQLLKGKLDKIKNGQADVRYHMKFV